MDNLFEAADSGDVLAHPRITSVELSWPPYIKHKYSLYQGCADLIFRIGIALILAFSAGSGYRSDETDPNSIFCIATIVLLLSPTKATNTYNSKTFLCTIFQVF